MRIRKKIAIAWNGSAEAPRALGKAMDFLRAADEVVVISVKENGSCEPSGDALADYLRWHGVQSRIITAEGGLASSGQILLDRVEEAGADMLVMGAYARDRIRRLILGCVTGEVLARMTIPVLMVD